MTFFFLTLLLLTYVYSAVILRSKLVVLCLVYVGIAKSLHAKSSTVSVVSVYFPVWRVLPRVSCCWISKGPRWSGRVGSLACCFRFYKTKLDLSLLYTQKIKMYKYLLPKWFVHSSVCMGSTFFFVSFEDQNQILCFSFYCWNEDYRIKLVFQVGL